MKVGLAIVPSATTIGPTDFARAAEERRFHSLFVSDHSHTPVSSAQFFPGGGSLPDEYLSSCDALVWLSYAAAVTERLRVGTGICLVAQHDAIRLAKQVATLDHLSGGRVVFGIGYG